MLDIASFKPILDGATRIQRDGQHVNEWRDIADGDKRTAVVLSRGGCAHMAIEWRFTPNPETKLDRMVPAALALLKRLRTRELGGDLAVPSLHGQLATAFANGKIDANGNWACGEANCSIRHDKQRKALVVIYDFPL